MSTDLGDDVAAHAAVDLADGQHGFLARVLAAADQGLELEDGRSGGDDGVDALVREGPVRRLALDADVDPGDVGHDRPRAQGDLPGGQVGQDVQPEQGVEAGILQDACRDQPLGAAFFLLGRPLLAGLEDEDDGAGQALAHRGQQLGGGQHVGHVGVVAAGVHPPRVLRGAGQPGRLLDGQGVHVGAQPDHGAGAAAAQDGLDAGAGDARAHFEPQFFQVGGDEGGRLLLLEAELGDLVQLAAQLARFRRTWRRPASRK